VSILGEFDDDSLKEIIATIRSIIPPDKKKYSPYYLFQVSHGNLHISRIEEDSVRLNQTIDILRGQLTEWVKCKGFQALFT